MCAALLWHLRVLAGWQPAQGAQAIRALAAGFEASNIAAHARRLASAPALRPHTLGALATAWSRLSETSSLAQLRDTLAQTTWGDPGSESPSDIALAVQISWAARVANAVPEARSWAYTRLALTVARRRLVEQRELPEPLLIRTRLVLGAAVGGQHLASFTDSFAHAGSAGCSTASPGRRLVDRGGSLVGAGGSRRIDHARPQRVHSGPTIGAVAVLAADAWRCRAALAVASRGGGPMDVYDVLT